MLLSCGIVVISKATIDNLQAQYDQASTEVRRRVQEQGFSPLGGDPVRLNTALTRVLEVLDDLFRLPDPLSTEFTEDERELIDSYDEGSTNLGEYRIGRAYTSIYRARELIYESSQITPETARDTSSPQVVRDIYELSDFICTQLIPLMNADQVHFYSTRNEGRPLSAFVNDFDGVEPQEERSVADIRRGFFEHLEEGAPITVNGEAYVFDSVDEIGANYFLAIKPGGSVAETFNTEDVAVEGRGQRLENDEVSPVIDQIMRDIDDLSVYMWKIIPIINNNIDKFTPEEKAQLQERLADYWIDEFQSGGAVNLEAWPKDYEPIFTGFSGEKAVELCNALTSYYASCISRGQLKDAVGIGEALELFGLDDVQVNLANAQRFKFLLMHLPREFWMQLSNSIDATRRFLPAVQKALPGYQALGAPARPALNEFQSEMLAIAQEIKDGGNGNRLKTLRRFVAAEKNGVVAQVFDAADPTDEAKQVREGIRQWLIEKGEDDPGEGQPLPLKYHPASANFRAAEEAKDEGERWDQVSTEVAESNKQFWDTVVTDEDAAAKHQERVESAQRKLDQPQTGKDEIFEGSPSDVALRMIGGEDDKGLQEYLREVARQLIQTYFPNTEITDNDVTAILEMRAVVMILMGENVHMHDLTAKQKLDIFSPLGLGENLEKLEVKHEDAKKLLEYQET